MDILRNLKYQNQGESDSPKQAGTLAGVSRPQTITELINAQITYHQNKIDDLKSAKEAISPEVEKALNALAKIS